MAWDPTVPATSAALLSAPIRENFAALDALMAAGPATPYPLTTLGDLFVGGVAGAPGRLGIGTTGQRLTVVGGVPAWQTVAAAAPAYPLLAPDGTAAAPSYSFASSTGSGLLFTGGTLQASVGGTLTLQLNSGGPLIGAGPTSPFGGYRMGPTAGSVDLILGRDTADVFAQRRSTNAQTFRLYNTFTDAANGEWLSISAGAVMTIGNRFNGTGVAREFRLLYPDGGQIAMQIPTSTLSSISLALYNVTAGVNLSRVAVANAMSNSSPSSTSRTFMVGETFNPTATSAMIAVPLAVESIINYSNATPGGGSYEALRIRMTETALPTGQSYMIRASGGAAGTTDRFAVLRDGTTRIFNHADYVDASNHSYFYVQSLSSTIMQMGITKIGAGTTTALRFDVPTGGAYEWRVANTQKWAISTAFHFMPGGDNAQDIGQASGRIGIRNLYLSTAINFSVPTVPGTPLTGTGLLYMKADKKLYFKDDAGLETALW